MKDLKPTQLLRLLAVAVLLSFLAACSDSDNDPDPGTIDKIFSYSTMGSCSNCHLDPSFIKATFKKDTVGKRANDNWVMDDGYELKASANSCGQKFDLVVPGNPDKSSLLMTFISDYANQVDLDCNPAIVSVHNEITGGLKENLVLWIKNGAN